MKIGVESKNKIMQNIKILNNFGLKNLPNLDVAVLGALELFQKISLPKLKFNKYKRPLVVGSGNAEATGRIIFENLDAVFASESNYQKKLKNLKEIDGVFLISSYAEKHAPIIAKNCKKYGKKITLLTNNPNSSTARKLDLNHSDAVYVFPKNREPYTYNTSTYMGMILTYTKENPKNILNFIHQKISLIDFSKLAKYDKFFLIVPTNFSGIVKMLEIKFLELFGREIASSVKTLEFIPHATTIVPAKELFISFGSENKIWGKPKDRIFVPLPRNADYGAMMAIGYYIMGKIQEQHPPYFKKNIVKYVKHSSEIFNHEIKAIVD